MSDDPIRPRMPRRGQLPFALIFTGLSLILLLQIGRQTTWAEGTELFAQPRFWPAVALIGMVGFGALHIWHLPRRRWHREDTFEAIKWLRVLEYLGWFLVYVWIVPVIGYLPASILFAPALTWRLGYRSKAMLGLSAGFAVAVVVLFKSVLQVRIPGGAVYEYLPDALRSFFILNF